MSTDSQIFYDGDSSLEGENDELYEAVETVFDYAEDGKKLSLDEVYSFTRTEGDRDEIWEVLNDLSRTAYVSSGIERTGEEEAEFVYWRSK